MGAKERLEKQYQNQNCSAQQAWVVERSALFKRVEDLKLQMQQLQTVKERFENEYHHQSHSAQRAWVEERDALLKLQGQNRSAQEAWMEERSVYLQQVAELRLEVQQLQVGKE